MTPFNPKSNVVLSVALSVCAYLIYLITPNQIFSFDALTNAIACERNEAIRWFHPNHPLYPSLGVLYYRLERLVGYDGLAIYSLARFNALLMATALGVFCYALSKKAGLLAAFTGACFLGATYAVWHFAVDGRAVGASVIFAVLLILKLVRIDQKQSVTTKDVVHLSLFSALYVLAHGIAIFHVAAVALCLARIKKREALRYAACVLGLLAVTYIVIYLLAIHPNDPSISFLRWAIGYASYDASHLPGYAGYWSNSVVKGVIWAWFGWKGSFVADPGRIEAHIAAWVLPIAFLVLLAGGTWKARRTLFTKEPIVLALILWGSLCEVFIVFWSPAQSGFQLHVLVPWTAALVILFHKSKVFLYGQGIVATAMFLWNLTGPISYAATITHNVGYIALREIRSHLSPGDLFVTAEAGTVPDSGVLLPYFFPEISGGSLEGRFFAFRETSLAPFHQSIQRHLKQKHRVYLHQDFMDAAVQARFERSHALKSGSLKRFLASYRIKPAFRLLNGEKVYALQK